MPIKYLNEINGGLKEGRGRNPHSFRHTQNGSDMKAEGNLWEKGEDSETRGRGTGESR